MRARGVKDARRIWPTEAANLASLTPLALTDTEVTIQKPPGVYTMYSAYISCDYQLSFTVFSCGPK